MHDAVPEGFLAPISRGLVTVAASSELVMVAYTHAKLAHPEIRKRGCRSARRITGFSRLELCCPYFLGQPPLQLPAPFATTLRRCSSSPLVSQPKSTPLNTSSIIRQSAVKGSSEILDKTLAIRDYY